MHLDQVVAPHPKDWVHNLRGACSYKVHMPRSPHMHQANTTGIPMHADLAYLPAYTQHLPS